MNAPSNPQQLELKKKIESQVYGDLYMKIQEQCFHRCFPTIGAEKSTVNERLCVQRCSDRYMDAVNIVGRVYVSYMKERGGGT